MSKKIICAYIPVLHEGYRRFLVEHEDADKLYLIGQTFTGETYLRKDIRALAPEDISRAIAVLGWAKEVTVLNSHEFPSDFSDRETLIVMPDEDISRDFAGRFLFGVNVLFDRVFLRWHKGNIKNEDLVIPDKQISRQIFDRGIMGLAQSASLRSSDFWRQVGAVLVVDNQVRLVGYNRHVPSAHEPYAFGDPRGMFSRGVEIELSTALHAEAAVLTQALKEGICTQHADLYITTFPCPTCAKLIAYSGIKRLYFASGYTVLNGQEVLNSQGVELIRVII